MMRVTGDGLDWQVLTAPWMLPETICDFRSDISLSTSTLALEMTIQRSRAIQTVIASRPRIGYIPQPPSLKLSIRNMNRSPCWWSWLEKVSDGCRDYPCMAALAWYSRFETFLRTSAMSSSAFWVLPFRYAKAARPMMPVNNPKAVQFIASEMPFDSSVAFCDGSTPATPANDLMRPVMVPSRPASVARLPSIAR